MQSFQGYSAEQIASLYQQYHALSAYAAVLHQPYLGTITSFGDSCQNATSELQSDVNQQNMMDIEAMLQRLNPNAEEYVPSTVQHRPTAIVRTIPSRYASFKRNSMQKPQKVPACAERWRRQPRTSQISTEESIKRTVYVSDIDQQVTEEQLATLFLSCGQVIDCRICGDPNSILRFAFVEFTNEEGAKKALTVAGTMLGYYPLRVLPSKTAILPVNPDYLPKSQGEKEMCARTIYCTNIDKKVAHSDVKLFFESLCGEVSRLRLLGDSQHSTRIAFVEFVMAESAMAALNCSGAILGSLPIRVSPSKTPLRPKGPRHHLLR
ncbi:unnamed protein product [Closterium sp. NIES-54]